MKKYNAGFLQVGAIILVATLVATVLLVTKLKSTVSVQDIQAVTGCGGHFNPGEHQYNDPKRPVDNGESECERAGCEWNSRANGGLGQCRSFPDESTSILTPQPTAIPTPIPSPVCQSTTISKTSLSGPGDSLTITSTATTSNITGFLYGFYNLDNLYGPSNPKPIWFTPNTDYTHADTVSPTNSHTTTITYDELNKSDYNWHGKPTNIQVNAFFGNSAGSTHSDPNCVERFNITLAPSTTLSCTSLTSNVANPAVGQSITGICRGTFPSSVTSPVARFGVNLNGNPLGLSGAIPLSPAGASYTVTVPQAGNYVVQCQICTDSTFSNCTTMESVASSASCRLSFTVVAPTLPPTPSPTPHADIQCLPQSIQVANIGQSVSFHVFDTGRSPNNIIWTASGGVPSSGTGLTFSTTYSQSGSHTVSVTDGGPVTSCSVSINATPSPSPSPSPTPSPTPTPAPHCNSLCITSSQCATGMTCSWGRCRNIACTRQDNCVCQNPTPTPTPTPTMTGTATPTPNEESKLKICKYDDDNGNGAIDGSDHVLDWNFFYSYQDKEYRVSHNWWNIFNRGCVTVTVPSSQWVKVWEDGKADWSLTNILSDGNAVGGTEYDYVSYQNVQKEVSFLNHFSTQPTATPTITPIPSGNPNSCNGTCGSNYNCASGLFCFTEGGKTQGYCRNPSCQSESSCGCPGATPTSTVAPFIAQSRTAPPVVLGATAPPQLPKTGSNDVEIVLGLTGLMGTGVFLFKKFKLV